MNNEAKATPAQTIRARELADRFNHMMQFGSKDSQEQALRAYERYVERIGVDPLV